MEQAASKTKLVWFAIGWKRSQNPLFPIIQGNTPDLAAAVSDRRFLGEAADDEIVRTVNELGSILAQYTQQDFRFFILMK